jgi:hypothetical protein
VDSATVRRSDRSRRWTLPPSSAAGVRRMSRRWRRQVLRRVRTARSCSGHERTAREVLRSVHRVRPFPGLASSECTLSACLPTAAAPSGSRRAGVRTPTSGGARRRPAATARTSCLTSACSRSRRPGLVARSCTGNWRLLIRRWTTPAPAVPRRGPRLGRASGPPRTLPRVPPHPRRTLRTRLPDRRLHRLEPSSCGPD